MTCGVCGRNTSNRSRRDPVCAWCLTHIRKTIAWLKTHQRRHAHELRALYHEVADALEGTTRQKGG